MSSENTTLFMDMSSCLRQIADWIDKGVSIERRVIDDVEDTEWEETRIGKRDRSTIYSFVDILAGYEYRAKPVKPCRVQICNNHVIGKSHDCNAKKVKGYFVELRPEVLAVLEKEGLL